MPANATLYLPSENIDLTDVFPTAARVVDSAGTEGFRVQFGEDSVIFNLMPKAEIPRHLAGFLRYIDSLDEEQQRKKDASEAVRSTRSVVGLKTATEFDDNHAIWASLFRIADKYDGYILTYDSFLLPNGAVIFGPLRHEE